MSSLVYINNDLNVVKQSERLIKIEERAGNSGIIGSQRSGLSHLTGQKSVLN